MTQNDSEIRYLTPPTVDVKKKKYCRFRKARIKFIDYKDPEFLKKFLNEQGKILPRRITGTSLKYQALRNRFNEIIKGGHEMQIILLTDIANLGHKDDIINVKPGYGRNYLIPQGYAILATESAKKIVAENIKQRAHKEAKLKAEAEELAAKLAELKLSIGAKTSSTGKIFGSVNNIMISEALAAQGFDIDRKKILLKDIKEVGTYSAVIKLHREVKVEVPFEVVSE